MLVFVVHRFSAGWTLHSFSPLAAYRALSYTMRASPQAIGFQVSSCSVPPGPLPEVCGVLSNRDLPSPGMSFLVGYPILNDQSQIHVRINNTQ